MKKIVAGILAHVDAGKTTLSESMLYLSGTINHQGRVDHQDAFLDYDTQERKRGITIFSKVSELTYKDLTCTFIDTPGHVDFSGEMERALSVLDVAILIISATDGVQSHTKTIWSLLKQYEIPTFIFVNKMDITYTAKEDLMAGLNELSPSCIAMQDIDDEALAMCSDALLEEYFDKGEISSALIQKAIAHRDFFPVYFGSALKNEGVEDLMDGLVNYAPAPISSDELSAQVYKIAHDERGERLTYVKVNSGVLHVKEEIGEEKIHQIRQYNGLRYHLVDSAAQGDVVVLTGLKSLQAGDVIGEGEHFSHRLQPYLRYALRLSENSDKNAMLENLKKLAQEEPLLELSIKNADHIEVSLMGEVQIEILKSLIKERYGEDVTIDHQRITYRETITKTVEGIGHFEPLRHYAEVHLLLEPLPQGSGLVFEDRCEQGLSENYRRLIMTHLQEKKHKGVLTGALITDMRITLLGGRAHQKHTEGGDFRQATYRAVRQGLMKAESILLEPYDHYEITTPSQYMGKIFYELEPYGVPEVVRDDGETAVLKGSAPIHFLTQYQKDLLTMTKGHGRLALDTVYYAPALNSEEIIEKRGYDPELDFHNPTGSVFCTHGSGFYVPYNEVERFMHLDYFYEDTPNIKPASNTYNHVKISDEELARVMERTYGPVKTRLSNEYKKPEKPVEANTVQVKPECLLVDGYNVIFAWDELAELAREDLGAARDRLIDILANYQGFKKCTLILVFDAYKVTQNRGVSERYHNIYIVYTKEAQTADMYIEAATKTLAKDYRVVVATSDGLEQKIVIGHGAVRMSSRELKTEIETLNKSQKEEFQRKNPRMHAYALEDIGKGHQD